jgi:3-oxoacyl-[acyl-carrier protein] reductase
MSKPTALVTGASRGIGAACAIELAANGFHVVVNYSSSRAKAEQVLEKIVQSGGSGEVCGFDVSDSQAVEACFSEITKRLGALSVLVNNAGIALDSLLIRLKDEDLERTLSVDLKGAIYCTREAIKPMMKARAGSIIFVSSVIGEMGNSGQSAYAAAKAGLIGFSKSVAKEYANRGIRSNVVTPGFIDTDMTQALTEGQKEAILKTVPMGTLANPQDIADLVGFLANSKSKYITGQVIGVNGGLYM